MKPKRTSVAGHRLYQLAETLKHDAWERVDDKRLSLHERAIALRTVALGHYLRSSTHAKATSRHPHFHEYLKHWVWGTVQNLRHRNVDVFELLESETPKPRVLRMTIGHTVWDT